MSRHSKSYFCCASLQLMAAGLTALVIMFGAAGRASAQDDGARAYMLAPNNVHLLSVYGLFLRGNQSADPGTSFRGASIDVNLALLQYTHPLAVNGNAGAVFVVVPGGEVIGRAGAGPFNLTGRSSGLGDIQIGGVIGLIGSPSLSPQAYAQYKPGFSLGALAKIIMPTGEYSPNKVLNLGANRWGVKVGLPITYYLGSSMIDPSLMTFELLPSVTFFSANRDPFGATKVEQNPLFIVEGHITRNLNRAIWVSFDSLYTAGGATTTDGVSDGNYKSAFALGGTVGLNLSSSASLKLTYGRSVKHNDNGADGSLFRVIASALF